MCILAGFPAASGRSASRLVSGKTASSRSWRTSAVIERCVQEYLDATTTLNALNDDAAAAV
jgi:hypothetical protein